MKPMAILLLIISNNFFSPYSLSAQIDNFHIREADAMWSTRIWREIDLRQKINQPLYYPLESSQGYSSLYQVLMDGINEGDLTAYGTGPLGQDDEFKTPMTAAEVRNITFTRDSIYTPSLEDESVQLVIVEDSVQTAQITRYLIKEDWVFDRSRSQMVVRIIGIAPMRESFGDDGTSRGFTRLFWVSFEAARPILAQAPVYLRHNDIKNLNYDDLFVKRYFDGFVVKSSNVYDRSIRSYVSGLDALLEGEAIEEGIRTMESDLWSY